MASTGEQRWAHDGTELAAMVRVLIDEHWPKEPHSLPGLLERVLDGTYDPRTYSPVRHPQGDAEPLEGLAEGHG